MSLDIRPKPGRHGRPLRLLAGAAAVVAPHWWRPEDLESLLHSLHLTLHQADQITFGEFNRLYPDAKLPMSVRRPWLFGGAVVAFVVVYLGVLVSLTLNF